MTDDGLPPGLAAGERVVLFDGVCRLCSAWARFLMRHDRKHRFRLATMQSPEGEAILRWFGFPVDHYQSMILVEGPRAYTESLAFIRVVGRLPLPWPLLCVTWLVPAFLRDWLYRCIASNRYRLFGRYDSCVLPGRDHPERFLEESEGKGVRQREKD